MVFSSLSFNKRLFLLCGWLLLLHYYDRWRGRPCFLAVLIYLGEVETGTGAPGEGQEASKHE